MSDEYKRTLTIEEMPKHGMPTDKYSCLPDPDWGSKQLDIIHKHAVALGKQERNKMLFDAALSVATHSTLSIEGAFDRAESFIKEYERRVNG